MITRKQILIGATAFITVAGALLLIQYYKLKNFTLKIRFVDIKKATNKEVNFDVLFDFINNSDLQIAMAYQTYDVFLNNRLITTIKSKDAQTIMPKASTTLKANVSFNPTQLVKGVNLADAINMALNIKEQNLKVVTRIGVKFFNIVIPVKATSEGKISTWLTS